MSLVERQDKAEAQLYREILAAVAAGNIGLTSDIDGTLSPIALTPSESFVPEGIRVGDWVLSVAKGVRAFYDIDTPLTLDKLARGARLFAAFARPADGSFHGGA